MTDKMTDGKPQIRRVLAPYPWPFWPPEESGPLFYLSWPGWELYLDKRLGRGPEPGSPQAILLPDRQSPELDFAAIDQLSTMAAELGTGFLGLSRSRPESLPGLVSAIENYGAAETGPAAPVLDDRSYLALWAIAEYQTRRSRELLDRAAASEKAMWAALKGEDEPAGFPAAGDLSPSDQEPDRRAAYAWQCWQRLAAPILIEDDVIIPAIPFLN